MPDAQLNIEQHPAKMTWQAVAFLTGLGFFLVAGGVVLLCVAFCPGESLASRLTMIVLSAAMFFPPGWFAFTSLRLKWKTGSWTLSPEERQARRVRMQPRNLPRFLQLICSPASLNTMRIVLLVLIAANITRQLRRQIHSFQLMMVLLWLALGVVTLWQLLHRPDVVPEA